MSNPLAEQALKPEGRDCEWRGLNSYTLVPLCCDSSESVSAIEYANSFRYINNFSGCAEDNIHAPDSGTPTASSARK